MGLLNLWRTLLCIEIISTIHLEITTYKLTQHLNLPFQIRLLIYRLRRFRQHFSGLRFIESKIEIYTTERIIVNDRFGVAYRTSKVIMLPKVDELGTQFVDEMLPLRFTIDLIDYESTQSGMLSARSDTNTGTVGWKSDVVKWWYGEPNGEVSVEYQKQLSASSSYWLGNQENKVKINSLKNRVNNKYQLIIANVLYENNGKHTVGLDSARDFINKFNAYINEKLKKFFKDASIMNNGR